MRAVASLPPKYRVPLTMFHLDGLSYQKVADFLDIPLGTAKTLIHRATAKLRSVLATYSTEEAAPMVQEVFNEHKLPRGADCTTAVPCKIRSRHEIASHPHLFATCLDNPVRHP